jgi:hypothetical protein
MFVCLCLFSLSPLSGMHVSSTSSTRLLYLIYSSTRQHMFTVCSLSGMHLSSTRLLYLLYTPTRQHMYTVCSLSGIELSSPRLLYLLYSSTRQHMYTVCSRRGIHVLPSLDPSSTQFLSARPGPARPCRSVYAVGYIAIPTGNSIYCSTSTDNSVIRTHIF